MIKNGNLVLVSILVLVMGYCLVHMQTKENEHQPLPSMVITPPPPVPTVTATPQASTSEESQKAASEAFDRQLNETATQIPRVADLRKMSAEEAHQTPQVLLKAGKALGKIAEAVAANPQLKDQAMGFYRECTKNDDYPTSVRSLCYSDFRNLAGSQADELLPADQVAPNVIKLSKTLSAH